MKFLTRTDKAKLKDLGLGEVFTISNDSPTDFFKTVELNWQASEKTSFMRDMTEYEKDDLRETYKEELEVNQPELLTEYNEAMENVKAAKEELARVKGLLDDSIEILRNTAKEIKSGRISQDLKQENVYQVAFRYNWIYLHFKPELKLFQIVHIREMYEDEKENWYNDTAYIEDFDFTSVFQNEDEATDVVEVLEDDGHEEEEQNEPLAIGQGQIALVACSQKTEEELESHVA